MSDSLGRYFDYPPEGAKIKTKCPFCGATGRAVMEQDVIAYQCGASIAFEVGGEGLQAVLHTFCPADPSRR